MTNEIDTGILERVWEKENRQGKMQHYLKLNGEVYSAFGTLPVEIKAFYDDAKTVKIEFTRSGDYRNVVGCTELHPEQQKMGDNQPVEPPKTKGYSEEKPPVHKDFPTADTLEIEDFVRGKLVARMKKCIVDVRTIYNLESKAILTDGHCWSVGTLFFELSKQMSRYPLIKEAIKQSETTTKEN